MPSAVTGGARGGADLAASWLLVAAASAAGLSSTSIATDSFSVAFSSASCFASSLCGCQPSALGSLILVRLTVTLKGPPDPECCLLWHEHCDISIAFISV